MKLKDVILKTIILKLLNDKETYGSKLLNTLDNISKGYYKLSEGSLYPLLYKLEEDKLIENYWSTNEEGNMPKKYYKITKLGKEKLKKQLEAWEIFKQRTEHIVK